MSAGDPYVYEDPSILWCANANCGDEAADYRRCESIQIPGGSECRALLCRSCHRQKCDGCGRTVCDECETETPDGNGILCAACAEIQAAKQTGGAHEDLETDR